MAIINQVVAGSGGSSVSEPYLEFEVVDGYLKSTTSRIMDFSGIKKLDANGSALFRAYYKNPNISGVVTFPDLEGVDIGYALQEAFRDCPDITGASFPKLKMIGSTNTLNSCFAGCAHLIYFSAPKLQYVYNTQSVLTDCSNLQTVDLSSLVSSGNLSSLCYRCSSLTTVDLSSLTTVSLNNGFANAFFACTALKSISFPHLVRLNTNNVFNGAFSGSGIENIYFGGLAYRTTSAITNNTIASMLTGVTGCTVHFPAELQTTIESFASYPNFGGTDTIVLFDLPNVRDVSYPNIVSLSISTGVFNYTYQSCQNITSINMPNLEVLSEGTNFTNAFDGCTGLTSFDFSSLTYITIGRGLDNTFLNCTSLTSAKFDSLKGSQNMISCFGQNTFKGCTSLAHLYFPAFKSQALFFIGDVLSGVTGCTVHMPANYAGTTFVFGGTNTTVLYDLPSTFILTGANSVEYERNPKYDTQTALAWRVKDGGTESAPIIDWTPYYTSGTTDPSVSDAIYSDAACTMSVTTITAIA